MSATPSAAAGDVVIETRNLAKVYRDFWGRSKKAALKPLDLEIRRGEIFGLLGPNGSGKTTTLKLLLGLIFPTSGEALVFGRPATDVERDLARGVIVAAGHHYGRNTTGALGRGDDITIDGVRPGVRQEQACPCQLPGGDPESALVEIDLQHVVDRTVEVAESAHEIGEALIAEARGGLR